MLDKAKTYEELISNFSWSVPEQYNIGVDICDKWAEIEPNRIAIEYCTKEGPVQKYTFGNLKTLSNKLANALKHHGAVHGDRIGILLQQSPEIAYSHIAIHKIGAISLPLFTLFEEQALMFRLENSSASILITDAEGVKKVAGIREKLPSLKLVFSVDGPDENALDFHEELKGQSEDFDPYPTKADDPALISFTSGTTGNPKGALHAHRLLLGHLPGMEMSHNFFPCPGDKIWTPADWAWLGGLLNVLMPALHHGVTVVACRFEKFNGEEAFAFLAKHGIRNTFLPPTAMKIMRQVENPKERWDYSLRTVASGGESLGAELIEWGRETFGLTINEFYGQTECNLIVSSCGRIMEAKPGFMGKAVPGHIVSIVDENGCELPPGTQGNVAVQSPDPVMFLEYWDNPEATREKFAGNWLLTGDIGICDEEGWFQFVGRDDDVINSAGYRIGPAEIEDCLLSHPKIAIAGVIGKPDPLRNEIVKAYVVLNADTSPSEELTEDIQNFVRKRLAAYEYPREIEFVDSLPMTTTGKIVRRELRRMAIEQSNPEAKD